MYNFLVTSQDGAWDSRFYEYPRDRVCTEYTTEPIKARFSELTPAAIEELRTFPTLFAYEGNTKDVRVGYIVRIADRGNTVYIEFDYLEGIPPIPFSKLDALRVKLDIKDRFELSRTHWAVKGEDLLRVLTTAGLLQGDPSGGSGSASTARDALNLGPQPRVVRLLGSGAEADVYLVIDRFNREVAAKVFYESKRVPEHIYGHAVGLARVPHQAVAELYTIEEVQLDGRLVPAIFMERLVGEELEFRLRREVSIAELIDWGRTLLDVFAAMHSVDHFHPDPHPGNFFVTEQGLRLYDVLYSLSAQNRSTGTRDSLRSNNARRIREIIEAMFDKLHQTDAVQIASRAFTSETRKANLTLEEIRRAFGDAVQSLDRQEPTPLGRMTLSVGSGIFYREQGAVRRASVTRVVDDRTVDAAIYDDNGNIVHGVAGAPLAASDAEKLIDGRWWPGP